MDGEEDRPVIPFLSPPVDGLESTDLLRSGRIPASDCVQGSTADDRIQVAGLDPSPGLDQEFLTAEEEEEKPEPPCGPARVPGAVDGKFHFQMV